MSKPSKHPQTDALEDKYGPCNSGALKTLCHKLESDLQSEKDQVEQLKQALSPFYFFGKHYEGRDDILTPIVTRGHQALSVAAFLGAVWAFKNPATPKAPDDGGVVDMLFSRTSAPGSRPPKPEGLADLKQPAKAWLADAFENFATLLGDDEDPSFTITHSGVVVEFRVMTIPGLFERLCIKVPMNKLKNAINTGGLDFDGSMKVPKTKTKKASKKTTKTA